MQDKCILDDNMFVYRIFGILFLIIILIFSLLYYFYIIKNKYKDTFGVSSDIQTSTGCYVQNQGNLDVEFRQCSIYMTSNISLCNDYEHYYQMSLNRLNEEITKSSSDPKLYNNLILIRDDKTSNLSNFNPNTCKYTFNDWYEINTDMSSSNIIKQYKNINNIEGYNFSLTNTCFNENKINRDASSPTVTDFHNLDIVSSHCDNPIYNINDINNPNKSYYTVNFINPISYDQLRQNICTNSSFNNNNYDLSSYFSGEKNILKLIINNNNIVKNLSIIKYQNKLFNDITDSSLLNNIIKKLFRYNYDNIHKKVTYTTKTITTTAYICNYDMCSNIITIDSLLLSSFSLNDILNITDLDVYTISDINLITNLSRLSNGMNAIDYRDAIIDKIDLTKKFYNEKVIKPIQDNIDTINSDISTLKSRIEINNERIKEINSDVESSINTIHGFIDSSDEDILKNINNNIKDTNDKCDRTYQKGYKDYLSADSDYKSAKKSYDENQEKYNDSIKFLNNNFKKGLYFKKRDYSDGIFRQSWINNQKDFTNSLKNSTDYSQIIISVTSPLDPFYTENSDYLDLFKPVNNGNYFTIQIYGNIKFDKSGYYYFMLNSDDAADFFISYRDDISGKMIFKNVANYYGGHGPGWGGSTTDKPIYIDATFNGGYYGIYMRVQELWGGSEINAFFTYYENYNNSANPPYKLTDTSFNYMGYNGTDVNNKKQHLNNISADPYRIHNTINDINIEKLILNDTDITNDANADKFFIKIKVNSSKNPGNPPVKPVECTVIPYQPPFKQHYSDDINSSYYTPLQINTNYIKDEIIQNYRNALNNNIDTIRTHIRKEYNNSNNMLLEINKWTSDIKTKVNNDLPAQQALITSNKEIINNLTLIKNEINTFDNINTYDIISRIVNNNNKIINTTYNKYIFSDNQNNKYIYIKLPDA